VRPPATAVFRTRAGTRARAGAPVPLRQVGPCPRARISDAMSCGSHGRPAPRPVRRSQSWRPVPCSAA
jgi:hypothetical protein